jgi:hypothetical protein
MPSQTTKQVQDVSLYSQPATQFWLNKGKNHYSSSPVKKCCFVNQVYALCEIRYLLPTSTGQCRLQESLKHQQTPTTLDSCITQKTAIFIFVTTRMSNLIHCPHISTSSYAFTAHIYQHQVMHNTMHKLQPFVTQSQMSTHNNKHAHKLPKCKNTALNFPCAKHLYRNKR